MKLQNHTNFYTWNKRISPTPRKVNMCGCASFQMITNKSKLVWSPAGRATPFRRHRFSTKAKLFLLNQVTSTHSTFAITFRCDVISWLKNVSDEKTTLRTVSKTKRLGFWTYTMSLHTAHTNKENARNTCRLITLALVALVNSWRQRIKEAVLNWNDSIGWTDECTVTLHTPTHTLMIAGVNKKIERCRHNLPRIALLFFGCEKWFLTCVGIWGGSRRAEGSQATCHPSQPPAFDGVHRSIFLIPDAECVFSAKGSFTNYQLCVVSRC